MKTWIGTSWKMNKCLEEALDYAKKLIEHPGLPHDDIVRFIAAPFTCARQVKELLSHTEIKVGAQNMHWETTGQWTGEISPLMLTDCGLDFVEIGHSERRENFNEIDHSVGLRVAAALRHGLVPLMCIGETLAIKEAGKADEFLQNQIQIGLSELKPSEKNSPIVIAYEPVWAIGEEGTPASTDYAAKRHKSISEVATNILGRAPAVIYGGSVNLDNCVELIERPEINGLFIGRAALDPKGFIDIISLVSDCLSARIKHQ